MPNFSSLAALNDWLQTRCRELYARTLHGSELSVIVEAWAGEVGLVRRPRQIRQARVADAPGPSGPQSLQRPRVVRQLFGQPAGCIPCASSLSPRGKLCASITAFFPVPTNRRAPQRLRLAAQQRTPGALRNGAPFVELPAAFRALQQRMLETPDGDRERVEILALVLQHDEQAVLAAVELALEVGARPRRSS
jgi:hypothetical protein